MSSPRIEFSGKRASHDGPGGASSSRWLRALCLCAMAAALGLPAYSLAGGGAPGKRGHGKAGKANAPHDTQPPESDGEDSAARRAPRGPGIATPGAVRSKSESDIEMGTPIEFHNISVVPVVTRRKGPFQKYTLFEDGLASRTFEVRELKGNSGEAQVNEVEVRNRGEDPVYLLGGEMILGGKQDRIIAGDTVIEPDRKWTRVSVFCVEQGRWRGQNMKFQSGKAMADVSIVRAAMSGSQSEVWSEVSKKNVLHGTQNATQTYRRTIQNGDLRKKIQPYVKELAARLPGDKQLAGLVFGVNGRIHVADIFGNPVLFQDLQGKLLSAYVLEALGHQVVEGAKPVSSEAAEQFVGKGRRAKSKGAKKAGRAERHSKEDADFIGSETVDTKTGKTVRETYIGK